MKFIGEDSIEKVITLAGKDEIYAQMMETIIHEEPAIVAYLESESNQILTDQEKDLQWYCIVVIRQAIGYSYDLNKRLSTELLEEKEEENYALVEQHSKFKEMADALFEATPQEDLLAFVEDLLIPDDEIDFLTPVGRKVLFVSLKTMIDAYDDIYR